MNKIYIIKALTNMHVGDGQANFNIIDKEIQRDVITHHPIIHASSLKGALRHFAENAELNEKETLVNYVFGKAESEGKYRFFDGKLLSIPVRSDKKPFFRATCKLIIAELLDLARNLQVKLPFGKALNNMMELEVGKEKPLIFEKLEQVKIEDYRPIYKSFADIEKLKPLLGDNIVLMDNADFCEIICELPVVARNKLENGLSKNLWYEEVVPRESLFYFGVIPGENNQKEFEKLVTTEMVQIGANASIGYGYTAVKDICEIAGETSE